MKLGWMDPPSSGYGYGYAPDPYGGSGNAPMSSPDQSYFGAVINYTSGVVVWSSVWTPVTDSPSPNVTSVATKNIRVSTSGLPVSYGILEISATVDGVLCENKLRIGFAEGAYGYYGRVGWDTTSSAVIPSADRKIGWCWDGTPTDAMLAETFAPSPLAAGRGELRPFSRVYAGLVDAASGFSVIDWTPVWTPVVDDPSPEVTPYFTVYEIEASGVELYIGGFPPECRGTMTLHAVIDGTPAVNYLTIVYDTSSSGSSYGSLAYYCSDLEPGAPPQFWTDFRGCKEVLS